MVPTFAGLEVNSTEDMPDDWGRWLIHGLQGSGKTTLASTIAILGKTLFIDLNGEKGVRSFKGAKYSKNIDIIRPQSITKMDDMFWELQAGKHDYKAVVIDSLTSCQKMTMRYLLGHDESAVKEITQGSAPADRRVWGQALDIMQDIAIFWQGLADGDRDHPMHVVMTAQTRFRENEDTGDIARSPDVQGGALSAITATPDYVLYTDTEPNMDAVSDESLPAENFIVRFGYNSSYRTKARIPVDLRGKIPSILGRKTPVSLASLSKALRVGGVPTTKKEAK